jgi:thymidine kinase
LRSDASLEAFEGSLYLMLICDEIEELKTICHCGKKATVNARIYNNKIVTGGEQIQIGGNESYISLCRNCFKKGIIKKII